MEDLNIRSETKITRGKTLWYWFGHFFFLMIPKAQEIKANITGLNQTKKSLLNKGNN